MRVHAKMKWLFAVAGIALATGPAGAQPTAPTSGSTPSGASGSYRASASTTVPFDDDVGSLSNAQMLAKMNAAITTMEATTSIVAKQTLEAEVAKDVSKTYCLKDAGSKLNKALESAKGKVAEMNALSTSADASAATTSRGIFSAFAAAKGQFDKVKGEAGKCVGRDATISGGTSVNTTIEATLPRAGDTPGPTDVGGPVVIIVAPPPDASKAR